MLRNHLAAKSAARGKSVFASPRSRQSFRSHRSLIEPLESRQLLTATVIEVNTTQDVVDPNDDFTSLREAILAANASPEDDEIILPAGTYTLTRHGANEDAGLTGDLDIVNNGTLRIIGANRDTTTIDASGLYNAGLSYGDRIFDVLAGANFSIRDMTLANANMGSTSKGGGAIRFNQATAAIVDISFLRNSAGGGGAIQSYRSTIQVSDSTFQSNSGGPFGGAAYFTQSEVEIHRSEFSLNFASNGGAIWSSSGQLALYDSTVSQNISDSGLGGGVAIQAGSASITDSLLSKNTAGSGGGLSVHNDAMVIVQGTTISENTAQSGAGVYAGVGTLTISMSTVRDNKATGFGGGIQAYGNSTPGPRIDITATTFANNTAEQAGGAICAFRAAEVHVTRSSLVENMSNGYGGAIFCASNSQIELNATSMLNNSAVAGGAVYNVSDAQLTIVASTLANNRSLTDGGAIYNSSGADLRLINSTISGNSARGFGGGLYSLQVGTVSDVLSSTFILNIADNQGLGFGVGGGIYAGPGAEALLYNSIVIGNQKGVSDLKAADDIGLGQTGAIDLTSSHNLIGDPSTAGDLVNGTNANIVGNGSGGELDIHTVLETTLADNGGPTLTHALRPTGIAVNSGDPAFDPNSFDPPVNFDQRGQGYPRIISGRVDIGAVEVETDPLPLDGVIHVTTFDDTVAIDGLWSLREAVLWANAHPEDNEIILSAGTYTLTRQGANEDAGLTGDLDVVSNGSLRIVGANRDTTTIDASGLFDAELGYGDRIFDVLAGANFEIASVTLYGGQTGLFQSGGAIRAQSAVLSVVDAAFINNTASANGGAIASTQTELQVAGSLFEENSASVGGAIRHDFQSPYDSTLPVATYLPTLIIQDSEFSGNQAGNGGAIDNTGVMRIEQSDLSGNSALGSGGAIHSTGLAKVIDSQVSGNTADTGGGVFSQFERYVTDGYAFELLRTTVSNNSATTTYPQAGGGGVVNIGRMLVEDSTISGNTSLAQGGGIDNYISLNNGLLHVIGSTFVGNSAVVGGAISSSSAPVLVVSSDFSDNTATDGGAIAASGAGGALTLSASSLDHNSASRYGGAIYSASITKIVDSTIENNSAAQGAGAYLRGDVTLQDSNVSGNTAQGPGGGLHLRTATGSIINTTFTENNAVDGGGLYSWDTFARELTLTQVTATGNTASSRGGAIYGIGRLALVDSEIRDNVAQLGGGVCWDEPQNNPDSLLSIVGSAIRSNEADSGGGLYSNVGPGSLSQIRIHSSTIADNSAIEGRGGGIFVEGDSYRNRSRLEIVDTQISGNSAHTGGGLYANEADLSMVGGSVTDNVAASGGGISFVSGESLLPLIDAPSAQAALVDVAISRNSAASDGGGIYAVQGVLMVSGGTLSGNYAAKGAAVYMIGLSINGGDGRLYWGRVDLEHATLSDNLAGSGGAIYNDGSQLIVRDSTFHANRASGRGAGVYTTGAADSTVVNSTLLANYADLDGGAIYAESMVRILNSTLAYNQADAHSDGFGQGGGLALGTGGAAYLENSIVAGNTLESLATPSDIALLGGSLDPAGRYNLVGDPATAGGLTDGVNGNIVGDGQGGVLDVNTVFDTSQFDNGGPTRTLALLPGSVAINAGDPLFDPNATNPATLFDQRGAGYARVTGGRVDMGAFEYGSVFEIVVAGRHIYYNNSKFDGATEGISPFDAFAIAPDKQALLPDGTLADAVNITSYSRGINGIMVDLAGSHPNVTAADFTFRMGASNDPGSWASAPEPLEIQVLAGQGTGGADRVVIIWPDGAIKNTYLQVIVKANENTGLATPDMFFFGNRVGDTFASTAPASFVTSAADEVATRNHAQPNVTITNPYDFDRNGLVSAGDQIIARNNGGFLPRIQIGSPAPVAPLTAMAASQASESRTEIPAATVQQNAIVSGLTLAGIGSKSVFPTQSHHAAEPLAVAEGKGALNMQSPAPGLADRAIAAAWGEVDDLTSPSTGDEELEDLLAELGNALGELSVIRA